MCDHHVISLTKIFPKRPVLGLKHRASKREEKQIPRNSFFKASSDSQDWKEGLVLRPCSHSPPGAQAAQALFQVGVIGSGWSPTTSKT